MDLRRYSDRHLLVIFAERGDIWDYKKQHELFSARGDEMDARDLVMLKFFRQKPSLTTEEVLDRGTYEDALTTFEADEDAIGDFHVKLVTRDGRVLIEADEPIDPDQIFRALERYDHEAKIEGL